MNPPRAPVAASPQPAAKSSFWSWPLVLVLVLIIAGGAYFYFRPSAAAAGANARGPRPISVTTVAAKTGQLHVYLTAIGNVVAWNTVTVHSRADGQLLKLYFVEGQRVKADDLLAEIDPRAYEVGLEQAEGQYARDLALLDNARHDLDRYQNAQEAVTPQQVDAAKAAVAQYEGIVRTDKGNEDSYKLQLSYCRILAPSAGRTGLRLVDEGNIIHASDTTGIVVITQDQPVAVFFNLPEDNLPAIRKAMQGDTPLSVDVYDRDKAHIIASGAVIVLDNQIDTASGTVRLKARFDNTDSSLFPNQFVNVRLLVEVQNNVTLIPAAAVQINGATRFVFVVKSDNTVEQRTVTLGKTEGDIVAVATGVTAGEMVVTEGLDKLQNGTAVLARLQGTPAPAVPAGKPKGQGWKGRKKDDGKDP